jgi:zinc/manganese transport system substrate-binding protein
MPIDLARRAVRCAIPGIAAVATLAATAACSTSSSAGAEVATSAAGDGETIQVVAAENFWGSIASQLGGSH